MCSTMAEVGSALSIEQRLDRLYAQRQRRESPPSASRSLLGIMDAERAVDARVVGNGAGASRNPLAKKARRRGPSDEKSARVVDENAIARLKEAKSQEVHRMIDEMDHRPDLLSPVLPGQTCARSRAFSPRMQKTSLEEARRIAEQSGATVALPDDDDDDSSGLEDSDEEGEVSGSEPIAPTVGAPPGGPRCAPTSPRTEKTTPAKPGKGNDDHVPRKHSSAASGPKYYEANGTSSSLRGSGNRDRDERDRGRDRDHDRNRDRDRGSSRDDRGSGRRSDRGLPHCSSPMAHLD